jgi:hypothetical protein
MQSAIPVDILLAFACAHGIQPPASLLFQLMDSHLPDPTLSSNLSWALSRSSFQGDAAAMQVLIALFQRHLSEAWVDRALTSPVLGMASQLKSPESGLCECDSRV